MKVALLLTGNLRTWRLCGQIVKNCLLKNYNCDVFMSVDLDNSLQHEGQNDTKKTALNELNDAIAFYNPKKYFFEFGYNENLQEKISSSECVFIVSPSPKVEIKDSQYHISTFSMNSSITKRTLDLNSLKIIFEQYYYCKKAYDLLEEYANETATQYDTIIRLRFDQLIWSEKIYSNFLVKDNIITFNPENIKNASEIFDHLEIDNPKDNEIYVFGCGVYHNYVYINDQFWIHNSSLISHMKNFYASLPNIISTCAQTSYPNFGAYIEHFFALHIKNQKIKRSCVSGIFIRNFFLTRD